MASHRINLRGPWDYDWRETGGDTDAALLKSGTASMPQPWDGLFGVRQGTAVFRRKFHRPTNLEAHEQVILVFTEVRGRGQAVLNQQTLGEFNGAGQTVEFEISKFMEAFNELTVEISFNPQREPSSPGGLFGVVALEIRWADPTGALARP
jgi:beta-galactosidase/beta-glucuronidase